MLTRLFGINMTVFVIRKANLLAENFQTSLDDAIQNPNAKIQELLEQKDTEMEMKQFHTESSTPLLPLKAPRELQCDEGPHDLKLEIYDAKQVSKPFSSSAMITTVQFIYIVVNDNTHHR